ncbi:hypothetical protein NN561_013535 [Cricetulus griseus]
MVEPQPPRAHRDLRPLPPQTAQRGRGRVFVTVRQREARRRRGPAAGGFEPPPGHGGCGPGLPRQRCGRGPSQAGAVAVLTPAGPRHGDEAESLPRAAAAAAARPPGGCGSEGGRVAPAAALAPVPASAAREAATGGAERARGARRQGAGKAGWGRRARVGAVGEGTSREDRAAALRGGD